jgi:tripartite-type tricarboxylate transporter receptor subunit TctC
MGRLERVTIMRRVRSTSIAFGIVAALLAQSAFAAGVEDFYKGKTISLVIGYSVGGGYDLYGRLLARHMGKYVPGQPTIVPQNMTGAGSMRAASFLYAAAPKDGTVFGTFGRTIATAPLLAPTSAPLDATKLTWLGSITNEVQPVRDMARLGGQDLAGRARQTDQHGRRGHRRRSRRLCAAPSGS